MRFWTASNLVSLLRLILTVPIAMAIMAEDHWMAFWLCWFAAFTDWLDGFVARATNTVSEWGKIIDPIADKVLVGTIVVLLLLQNLMPVWFVVAVVARDVIILAGGLVARRFATEVPPSMWSGKLAVTAIALAGVTALVQWTMVRDIFMTISCILMAVSLWQYGERLHGIIRQAQENT